MRKSSITPGFKPTDDLPNKDELNEELWVPVSYIPKNPPNISEDVVLDQPGPSKGAKLMSDF